MKLPTFISGALALSVICFLCPVLLFSQESVREKINRYGTLDRWSVRAVRESKVLGGEEKQLFEFFGDRQISRTKTPFKAPEGYWWRTNNVLASIMGITKTNTTVYPEKRGSGYCARLETHIESVKVLGLVNMDVVCQGAFFLGELVEPIRDTKDPMAKVLYGIPYSGRPEYVQFDYKADVGHETVRGTGFSALKRMGYPDYPIVSVILQKRWEEADGRVKALRVGTAMKLFRQDEPDWINSYRLDIRYGNIEGKDFFETYMGLNNDPERAFHCINSKGENVVVEEIGWADEDEMPNTLIISFLSSSGEPFYGGVGNILWIDNVKLSE